MDSLYTKQNDSEVEWWFGSQCVDAAGMAAVGGGRAGKCASANDEIVKNPSDTWPFRKS